MQVVTFVNPTEVIAGLEIGIKFDPSVPLKKSTVDVSISPDMFVMDSMLDTSLFMGRIFERLKKSLPWRLVAPIRVGLGYRNSKVFVPDQEEIYVSTTYGEVDMGRAYIILQAIENSLYMMCGILGTNRIEDNYLSLTLPYLGLTDDKQLSFTEEVDDNRDKLLVYIPFPEKFNHISLQGGTESLLKGDTQLGESGTILFTLEEGGCFYIEDDSGQSRYTYTLQGGTLVLLDNLVGGTDIPFNLNEESEFIESRIEELLGITGNYYKLLQAISVPRFVHEVTLPPELLATFDS